MKRKVFLAIPSHTGKPKEATRTSIACFHMEATSNGWELEQFNWAGDSLIVHARNVTIGKFLESDCTDIFFLDDDVAVGPGVFTRLMMHPEEMVAAVYRQKKDEETYAVNFIDQEFIPDQNTGLLEVHGVPFGMVRMHRAGIERMVANEPPDSWFWSACAKDLKCWLLFNTMVRDHIFYGEDMLFCEKYRAAGGKVWVDTEVPIQHIGQDEKVYAGHLGAFLRKHKAKRLKAVA